MISEGWLIAISGAVGATLLGLVAFFATRLKDNEKTDVSDARTRLETDMHRYEDNLERQAARFDNALERQASALLKVAESLGALSISMSEMKIIVQALDKDLTSRLSGLIKTQERHSDQIDHLQKHDVSQRVDDLKGEVSRQADVQETLRGRVHDIANIIDAVRGAVLAKLGVDIPMPTGR